MHLIPYDRSCELARGGSMKRALLAAALLLAFVGVSYAHGGNEHVRGTVTQVSATSITVQTAKKAEAIKLLPFSNRSKYCSPLLHTANMSPLHANWPGWQAPSFTGQLVGVDVDVSGETHIAESVNFGTPPAAAKAGAKPPAHK